MVKADWIKPGAVVIDVGDHESDFIAQIELFWIDAAIEEPDRVETRGLGENQIPPQIFRRRSFTDETKVSTAVPFGPSTGLKNVPVGQPVLLHGANQASYNWSISSKPAVTAPTLEELIFLLSSQAPLSRSFQN